MKPPLAAIALLLLQSASWQLLVKFDPEAQRLTLALLRHGDAKVLRVDFGARIQ